jgi:hypothetical protein
VLNVPTKKPQPAEALTKREHIAALIAAGIFAGPAGQVVLDSHNTDEALKGVADVAVHAADVLIARSAA